MVLVALVVAAVISITIGILLTAPSEVAGRDRLNILNLLQTFPGLAIVASDAHTGAGF